LEEKKVTKKEMRLGFYLAGRFLFPFWNYGKGGILDWLKIKMTGSNSNREI